MIDKAMQPTPEEVTELDRIAQAKVGKYIRIRAWTEGTGSSMETAAKSISAAVKVLRTSMRHYANWRLEFISEEPPAPVGRGIKLLSDDPTRFDYLHAIRAVASRTGNKEIFDLADAGMSCNKE